MGKLSKQARRESAQKRQTEYDSLSIDGKIKLAQSRRGESKREIERLLKKKEEKK